MWPQYKNYMDCTCTCCCIVTKQNIHLCSKSLSAHLRQRPTPRLLQITLDTSGAGIISICNGELSHSTCIAVVAIRKLRKITKAQGRVQCSWLTSSSSLLCSVCAWRKTRLGMHDWTWLKSWRIQDLQILVYQLQLNHEVNTCVLWEME